MNTQLWIVKKDGETYCVSKESYAPSIGDEIIADGFLSRDSEAILVNAYTSWKVDIVCAKEDSEEELQALGPVDDSTGPVSVYDVFGDIAITHDSFAAAVATLDAGRKVAVNVTT